MKSVKLDNWVKQSAPPKARPSAPPGSVEELRAQITALRKENRKLVGQNVVVSDAAAAFGAALDRQRRHSLAPAAKHEPVPWATRPYPST